MITRHHALQQATRTLIEAGIPESEARSEARLLLLHAAEITREALLMDPFLPLSTEQTQRFDAWVQRRAQREPLAYILGEREFYGLPFTVTPAVLIPRPETELLVELTLRYVQAIPGALVADIGTGSGCIAVAVARNAPTTTVYATDISRDAVSVAQENFQRNNVGGTVRLFQGDLLAPLPMDRRFDVIVSNPPYISPEEIAGLEPEVRDFEPRTALGENPDALHFYRRLAVEAPPRLKGALMVEVGFGQAEAVATLFQDGGLQSVQVYNDLAGIARAVVGLSPEAMSRSPFASD